MTRPISLLAGCVEAGILILHDTCCYMRGVVNDLLVHPFLTVSWGKTMLRANDLVFENAPHFPLSLLLMHGTRDEIAGSRGSQMFAELAPKDKLTLKMWDGFKHELFTDPEK